MPFPPSTRRLILRSPNGSRIELDADEARIRMFGLNGILLAELDASQEFFGDSLFVQKIYDFLGNLRTQISGLQIFVSGDDGKIEISAGSSNNLNSLPTLSFELPAGVGEGVVRAEDLANHGASLTIQSPSYSTHDQALVVLFAENDTTPSHVDITAGVLNLTGDLSVSGLTTVNTFLANTIQSTGTVVVGTDLSVGDDLTVTGDLTVDGVNVLGAWQTYSPSWAASAGTPAINNGSLVGRYMEMGRTFFVTIRLLAGNTTTYGTLGAFWRFGLPAAFGVAAGHFTGSWRSTNSGVQEYSGVCCVDSGTDLVELFIEGGRHANNNPFTFGDADHMTITLMVESNA